MEGLKPGTGVASRARTEAVIGCLLGMAVGDAIGLPPEGLSPQRAARMYPPPLRHHLILGRGMVSDDTDHACLTARALLLAGGDAEAFDRTLASSLRCWLAGLPAGVGFATLRAILKSCVGMGPERSGVASAGNGPAMRSAIIGVVWGHAPDVMVEWVRRSTRLTHTDPKALQGAVAVALAAYQAASAPVTSPDDYLAALARLLGAGADEFMSLAHRAAESAARGEPVARFAESIGSRRGISGYILHTVPCVLQVYWRFPDDYAAGIEEIVRAGGDTDTAAAILGAIVGARVGKQGIPRHWLSGVTEWPRGMPWIERLGATLAARGQVTQGEKAPACPGYFVPGVPLRNLAFLLVVLAHGFRRLAPPY